VLLQKDEVYLNLVLEYVPETVYRVARNYSKNKQTLPPILIKVTHLPATNCSFSYIWTWILCVAVTDFCQLTSWGTCPLKFSVFRFLWAFTPFWTEAIHQNCFFYWSRVPRSVEFWKSVLQELAVFVKLLVTTTVCLLSSNSAVWNIFSWPLKIAQSLEMFLEKPLNIMGMDFL